MSYLLIFFILFIFLPAMCAAFALGWGVGRAGAYREIRNKQTKGGGS